MVGAPRFELGTSCAQGRRATRLRYAPTETAQFILKHFPTLLLIPFVIFGLAVPKLCQILLRNRGCARIQRHLIGLIASLFRTARNGTTLKLYMRATIRLYRWNSAA